MSLLTRWSKQRAFLAARPIVLVVLFLLLAPPILLLLKPSEAPAEPRTVEATGPVVFMVFDEWSVSSLLKPNGEINELRYPNIATLASRSTWFPYTGAAHPFTEQAVPAIMTGGYAKKDAEPTADSYPNSVFTLFGESYRVHAFESSTHLCPDSICNPPSNYNPPPRLKRADRFEKFLGDIDASDKTLHFLHLILPHAAFEYLPSGRRYEPGPPLEGLRGEVWDAQEPWYATFSYERDLLQARFTDRLVGELIAHLEQLGIFDQTTIVITADHGVSFRPGQAHRRALGESKYEVGLVPFFIKAPYQATGVTNTTHVRSIDVLPTLAGQLGISIPWATQGRDMVAQPDPPVELRIIDPQRGDSVLLEDPENGLREATARLSSIFGDGASPYDLYAFGPHADLVGMPLNAAFAQAGEIPPPPVVPVRIGNVHPSSGVVPAFVNGLVDTTFPPGTYIGIAINGTIGTIVPAMPIPRNRTRFIAVVPDDLFSDGDNDISAVRITGSGQSRRIEPIDDWSLLGDRVPPP